ncbi:hypothetical protein ACFL3H_07895 [Gemmatimonadota bacterium]
MRSRKLLLPSITLFLISLCISCSNPIEPEEPKEIFQVQGTVYSLPDSLPIPHVPMALHDAGLLGGWWIPGKKFAQTFSDSLGRYSIIYDRERNVSMATLRAEPNLYEMEQIIGIRKTLKIQSIDVYLRPAPHLSLSVFEGAWIQASNTTIDGDSLKVDIDSLGHLRGFNYSSLCSCSADLEIISARQISGFGVYDSTSVKWHLDTENIPRGKVWKLTGSVTRINDEYSYRNIVLSRYSPP